jgi:hypothetical protein
LPDALPWHPVQAAGPAIRFTVQPPPSSRFTAPATWQLLVHPRAFAPVVA